MAVKANHDISSGLGQYIKNKGTIYESYDN